MLETLTILETVPPIHPGEILREEFLDPHGLTAAVVAEACRTAQIRIERLIAGEDGISADLAIRFARYFGTTPEFWLNLQKHYDLEIARSALGAEADLITPLGRAA